MTKPTTAVLTDVDRADYARMAQERKQREAPQQRAAEPINSTARATDERAAGIEAAWKNGSFTAEQLQGMTFPALSWVVLDIIPAEGVALLCSKPKFGKSWLAYDLCIACTMGRATLGDHRGGG